MRASDGVRDGLNGSFGVPGKNVNVIKVAHFRVEMNLCIANNFFPYKSIHKYTWVG